MKMMALHELISGMILAEDVYGKFDLLYASKGDVLSDKLIEGITRLGHQYVSIQDEESESSETVEPESPIVLAPVLEDGFKDYHALIQFLTRSFQEYRLLNKEVTQRIEKPLNRLMTLALNTQPILMHLQKLYLVDGYTMIHSIHVSILSMLIAQWMELSEAEQWAVGYAGLMHDLGKSKIPIHILNKPSKLTPEEYQIICKHSETGYDMVRGLPEMNEDIRKGILHHHEKIDGSGYPKGISEYDIHYYGQIVGVADIYSAMTADKVYNRKLTPMKATEEVFSASCNKKINAEIANHLLRQIYRMLVGTRVRLNNGSEGEIVYFNRFNPSKPLIRLNADEFLDLTKQPYIFIDEIL